MACIDPLRLATDHNDYSNAFAFSINGQKVNMKKSKFFRVFTEGHTTDGRVIQRNWIEEIVETYNTKIYGARVWLEHVRGLLPDSSFKAFGDVIAVKAEEVEDGKLALFAQIAPTDELIAMTKARQKIYTSVEIDPDFAKTGKCYLSGLAVTDSPASLGTEMLKFSASSESKPLAARKQKPDNLFTASVDFNLELEAETDETPSKSLFTKVKELLKKSSKESEGNFADIHHAVEALAGSCKESADKSEQFSSQLTELNQSLTSLKTEHSELQTQFNTLQTQLQNEEQGTHRAPATGGDNTVKTDC